jgi:stage II sporulation protein B
MKPTSNSREDKPKMDKSKEGRTITIKINGKESPFKEKNKKEMIDEQKVDSNKQTSTSANPIKLEAAAAQEKSEENDNFDWILPNPTKTPVIEEFHNAPDPIKKKKKVTIATIGTGFKMNKHSFKNMNLSILFVIFFAVLLGTFFGLMLLKIVPAETVVEDEQPVINSEVQNQPAEENSKNTGTLQGTRQAISAAVVQEGIYSSKEGAQQNKKDMNDRGIPAEVFPSEQQFALFVGISNNVESAKLLGNTFKSSGIDTYSKQWNIEEKNISNLHEEEKKLLELSPQIYESLMASLSSANGTNKIPQNVMENVAKQTSSLNEIDKDKLQNKNIVKIHSQLEASVAQIKLYENKPQSSTLNSVQQHLLTFLTNYQSL